MKDVIYSSSPKKAQKSPFSLQCHLVRPNFVKLRGKSSGLLLKNILGNKFPIKLSNFEKWKFIENLWTSMFFGGII